jgi:hypothetical protein
MRRASRLLVLPLLVLPAAVLPGCQLNERTTGTIAGAAGGALLGAALGGTGAVLLGAAGGGLLGYVVGDYLVDCRCGGGGGGGGGCGACSVPSACEVPCAPAAVHAAPTPNAHASAARAAYERGRAAATSGEARAAYEESLRLDASRPEPWNALAVLSLAEGRPARARTELERALAIDPAYAPARTNLERLERGS